MMGYFEIIFEYINGKLAGRDLYVALLSLLVSCLGALFALIQLRYASIAVSRNIDITLTRRDDRTLLANVALLNRGTTTAILNRIEVQTPRRTALALAGQSTAYIVPHGAASSYVEKRMEVGPQSTATLPVFIVLPHSVDEVPVIRMRARVSSSDEKKHVWLPFLARPALADDKRSGLLPIQAPQFGSVLSVVDRLLDAVPRPRRLRVVDQILIMIGRRVWSTMLATSLIALLIVAWNLAPQLIDAHRVHPILISNVETVMALDNGKSLSMPSPFVYEGIEAGAYINPAPLCKFDGHDVVAADRRVSVLARFDGYWGDDLLLALAPYTFGLIDTAIYPAIIVVKHRNVSDDPAVDYAIYPRISHSADAGLPLGATWGQLFKLDGKVGDWVSIFAVAQRGAAIDGHIIKKEVSSSVDRLDHNSLTLFLMHRFASRIAKLSSFLMVDQEQCG